MTITVARSGSWDDTSHITGPWPGASTPTTLPTSADAVILNAAYTLTLKGAGMACLSLTQSAGTIAVDATANWDITFGNATGDTANLAVSGGTCTIDMSGAAAYNGTIYLNKGANTAGLGIQSSGTCNVTLKGATRKRWTRLNGGISAGATSATVDDATGWKVGDAVMFGTTQPYLATAYSVTSSTYSDPYLTCNVASSAGLVKGSRVTMTSMQTSLNTEWYVYDVPSGTSFRINVGTGFSLTDGVGTATLGPKIDEITLATVNTGTGAITWSDGKGVAGGIAFDHADNGYVGNFSSNLTILPYGTNLSYVALDNSGTRVVQDVALTGLAGSVFAKYGLSLNYGNTTVANVSNNAFYSASPAHLLFLRFLGGVVTRDDNIFYTRSGNVFGGQSSSIKTGDTNRAIVFRSGAYGLSPIQADDRFVDCVSSGTGAGVFAGDYGQEFVRCSLFSNTSACFSASGAGQYAKLTDCDIGTEFGAYNGTVFGLDGAPRFITTGCLYQTSGTFASGIPGATKPQFIGVDLVNKNADVTLQESYYPHCTIKRDNTTHYRSPSSVSVAPLLTATDSQRTVSVPCPNGSSVTVVGYVQKSHATNVSATVAITGLGSSVTPFTKANDTNWEQYTLTATNSSGTDGNFTLTYTANSSSGTTNVVYFDGVPDAPLITVARHYGKQFPQTTPNAVANDAVVADETTALTYSTKFSITGGAAQSDVALAADATFQQLYDYTQAWSVTTANQGYAVPCTSPLAGILIAAGDVTTTGYTLNGAGSLAMGAHTLTGSIPFSYTYTGGTWSQASTVPSFSGGTLTLPTAITTSPGFTMTTGAIVFDDTSADWDLSTCIIGSGVTLSNTSGAGITVAMPAGYPTTTIGSGATEIIVTAPVLSTGIDFGGIVSGSTVKVFATGTQTVLATPTGPGWLWSETYSADQTVDYTIQKAGYDPIRVTGVPLSDSVLPISVQQATARAYVASSGLTFGTNCYANPTTKLFGLTTASTLQNFYSRMIESWITEATLQNKPFPITPNGPNSFTLGDGWDWDLTTYPNSIALLSRDGMRLTDTSGNVTQLWAAILSVGVPAGKQVRYQQVDGSGTTNAQATGNMDQLIQILSDPNGDGTYTDGYDKRGHLVLKVQSPGYDEAAFDAVATYGTLEDQFYVAGLAPTANGIADATTGALTITDHGASPVTWNATAFSLTITDDATGHTGEQILQYLRHAGAFNYGDLVQANGAKFKTVRAAVYGDTGAAIKGVRVLTNAGAAHPDFDLFQGDSADYVPPVSAPISWAGAENLTTCILYNNTQADYQLDAGSVVSGSGGYSLSITLPHAHVSVGDTLRLRYAKVGMEPGELLGVMTASGLSFVGTMETQAVYAAWLADPDIDITSLTEFTADGTNIDFDISTAVDTKKVRLAAWWHENLAIPSFLNLFYGALTLEAANSIRQNVATVDVVIDNTSGYPVAFTDNNVRYYRSDFSLPYDVTHSALFMDYSGAPFVSVVSTTAGVVTGTPATVAAAVRSELAAELEATTELWRRHGLDIAAPLTQTTTSITAGTIDLAITGDPDVSVTVTRQP